MGTDDEKTSATALSERLKAHVQRDKRRFRSHLADRPPSDLNQKGLPLAGSDDQHAIPPA